MKKKFFTIRIHIPTILREKFQEQAMGQPLSTFARNVLIQTVDPAEGFRRIKVTRGARMKMVQIHVPEIVAEEIKRLAREHGTSQKAITTELILRGLDIDSPYGKSEFLSLYSEVRKVLKNFAGLYYYQRGKKK